MSIITKFKAVIADVAGEIQHEYNKIFSTEAAAKEHITKVYEETSGAFNGYVEEVKEAPAKVEKKVVAEAEKVVEDTEKVLDNTPKS